MLLIYTTSRNPSTSKSSFLHILTMGEFSLQARHGFCFAVGDHVQDQRLLGGDEWTVDTVVSTAFKLDDFVFLQQLESSVTDGFAGCHGVGIDEILELVVLFELLLGHQVIELGQDDAQIGVRLDHPTNLAFGSLEVAVWDELSLEATLDVGDFDDAPAQENDLFADGDAFDIDRFQQNFLSKTNDAISQSRILGMVIRRQVRVILERRTVCHRQHDVALLVDCHETLGGLVDFSLVFGPEFIPLHVHHTPTGALGVNELAKGWDVDTTTNDPAHRRHASIVPSSDESLFHEPCQLALGEDGEHEVHSCECVDADTSQPQCLEDPLVLLIAVVVLRGAEGMGDALEGVHDGAC
mmetsp:Transcript_794/g.1886  ORF Transcript_794/g.1886 Transcript_794/m.1886 type:complete len:353 (+) Transcript_794:112-1170(+)